MGDYTNEFPKIITIYQMMMNNKEYIRYDSKDSAMVAKVAKYVDNFENASQDKQVSLVEEAIQKREEAEKTMADNIHVVMNFAPLMQRYNRGDYFVVPIPENTGEFKLLYFDIDQGTGRKTMKSVDGIIDPPKFKLLDRALAKPKTYFENEDLQACIDACLAKKLGQTMTPAMAMDKQGKHAKEDQTAGPGMQGGKPKPPELPKSDPSKPQHP